MLDYYIILYYNTRVIRTKRIKQMKQRWAIYNKSFDVLYAVFDTEAEARKMFGNLCVESDNFQLEQIWQ